MVWFIPTAETLEKLCKNLEITPKQLFDFDYYSRKTEDIKNEINILIKNNQNKITDT